MPNQALLAIYLTLMLDLVGFGIILPQLPLLARDYGATSFMVTALSSVYSFWQMLGAYLWGYLSDKFGRKPIISICVLGEVVFFALMGYARSYTFLVITRGLQGLFAGNLSSATAYIVDVTDSQSRARHMGYVGAAMGLGLVVGPILGAFLFTWGFKVSCLAAAGCALLNLVSVIAFVVPPPLKPRVHINRTTLFNSTRDSIYFGFICLAFAFQSTAFAALEATFALLYNQILGATPIQIGIAFTIAGLASSLTQALLVPRVTSKLGLELTCITSCVLRGVGFCFFPFAFSDVSMMVAMGLCAIFGGFIRPCLSVMASVYCRNENAGRIMGIFQMFGSLCRAIGPLIAGSLYEKKAAYAYYFGGLAMLAAAACIVPRSIDLRKLGNLGEKQSLLAKEERQLPLLVDTEKAEDA